ncbi:MAG: UDP-N-acetylmuramate dehydrogenase [Bacteroidales bacterium]|nr:UDP-N-acetylmuramate dehydrogenase [Bacteroidales bacterium]
MLSLRENISLLSYNTFGIALYAKWFAIPETTEDVIELLRNDRPEWKSKFVLGGGSNVLFTRNYEGLIIHPEIKGMEKVKKTKDNVWIRVGSGENWDDFVCYCVSNDLGGLENLSHIPGNVGASPVQNIGAYGAEVKDCIEKVETVMLKNCRKKVFSARECKFDYRNSIFKKELKNRCIITHVTFRLTRNHEFKTRYPDLEKELDGYPETSIQTIREAIIAIRKKKLPEPAQLGNAGSFFKNPVLNIQQFNTIRQSFPSIPGYKCEEQRFKISAAWLIEQCHWKGKRIGNVGTYKKQPLVIVNHGSASGTEIVEFARRIQRAVKTHFGITLETEVNIL